MKTEIWVSIYEIKIIPSNYSFMVQNELSAISRCFLFLLLAIDLEFRERDLTMVYRSFVCGILFARMQKTEEKILSTY